MKTIMKKNHEDLDRDGNDEEADGEEGEAGDGQGHLRQQSFQYLSYSSREIRRRGVPAKPVASSCLQTFHFFI